MFKFEELNVYQEALKFANEVYRVTQKWPKQEMFGLIDQLRRASVSIALNIAEGTSRTKKDFGHFLDLSRGSCFECVAVLTIARDQNYINTLIYEKLYSSCVSLSRMLSALKNSLS